jgi:hypothetical protein
MGKRTFCKKVNLTFGSNLEAGNVRQHIEFVGWMEDPPSLEPEQG